MKTTVFAPGKLFLAGEYAVTKAGNHAILVAVDRGITVTSKDAVGSAEIISAHFKKPLWWQITETNLLITEPQLSPLLSSALKTCFKFARDRKLPFYEITQKVTSTLESPQAIKYGLGSSGAVVVALIKSFNEHFEWQLSLLEIFKLACLATWGVDPSGSAGDIAASCYGGLLFYTAPEKHAITSRIAVVDVAELEVADLVAEDWKSLEIVQLHPPRAIKLHTAWTGQPALTSVMTQNTGIASAGYANAANATPTEREFIFRSNEAVLKLREALHGDDPQLIFAAVTEAKQNLLDYVGNKNLEYETEELRKADRIAAKHGAIAKISGAGGGDCLIAFSAKQSLDTRMLEEWKSNGIENLSLNIYYLKELR